MLNSHYALRNGHEVVKEYIDEAESGRSIDRPAFKEMIATVHQKSSSFQAIFVWKLSRFARNREDSIVYKSLLRKHGVQLISINEPLEDTPAGKLLEGVIEVIDEFYSNNLAQDVIRGQRENADGLTSRTGKKWGTTLIEKILYNEAYTGTLVWGRRTKNHGQAGNSALLQRTEDAWPVIVDRATFTQAQAKLSG
ncbi:unnamed protein product, partial [marine sediment metagenome]